MIQVCNTWGPMTRLHASMSAVRAIENGFTLLRCSSDGVSSIVSPFGETRFWAEAGSDDTVVATMALVHPAVTPYSLFGDVFGWFCVVVSILYITMAFSCHCIRSRLQHRKPNRSSYY
jgi:apolipoprotein N-acyltransferase